MSFRASLVLLLAFLALGGYVYFFELPPKPQTVKTAPQVWTVKEDEIQRIEVRYQGISVAFHRTDGATWQFEDANKTPVDMGRWGGIPLLLSGPRSKRLVAQGVDDLGVYGLARPQMQILLGTTQAQTLDIQVGDKSPDEKNYYIKTAMEDAVYLVDYTWGDVMARLVTEPPKPIPTPTPTPSPTPVITPTPAEGGQ